MCIVSPCLPLYPVLRLLHTGHYSPVVKQLRAGARPDGMVLVVGGCATGFAPEANTSADLLHSFTDASADMQLFFEAFPAQGGAARTTYCFAYTDAHSSRPSFERLLVSCSCPAQQHPTPARCLCSSSAQRGNTGTLLALHVDHYRPMCCAVLLCCCAAVLC